ncbi:hypothetical protein ACIQ9R_05890 [Streptomyces sp. NPDC094447]|uniref:hypothetical protein n=1 Tax=unclassified Streptomyces TaxID=2593676 RepID=UPI003712B414
MTGETRVASTDELEAAFLREMSDDRWAAAETAYALAALHRDLGNWSRSREWVKQCLHLLDGFPSDSEEQVATKRLTAGGVPLPHYLHDGVVRARFGNPA